MTAIAAPFFEIGPKNLLRRDAIVSLALAAGAAGAEHGVTVLLTVPATMLAPVAALDAGVVAVAQGMGLEGQGPSMDVVTAEALADAGASAVMLDHDARRLTPDDLAVAIARAHELGLQTVVCADDDAAAVRAVELGADVVLHEPPALIGGAGAEERPWIPASTAAIRAASTAGRLALAMHAGGVASPAIAEAIMAAGADGTGSTSGVVAAADPPSAAAAFIAATRAGWDRARSASVHPIHHSKETP